ncbi:MAG: hypothetical protein QXT38_02380 [Candidatus Aenigmatarchaeota archaeon]
MIEIRRIKGVKKEDLERWMFGSIPIEVLIPLCMWGDYNGSEVFRAFSPSRLDVVIREGTDRTDEYLSPYDRRDVIYAGRLEKAIEYGIKHFEREGKACIAVYREDMLEKVDIYTYKPKEGRTFSEALLGVVIFER